MVRKKQKTKIKLISESSILQKTYSKDACSIVQKLNELFQIAPSFIEVQIFKNRASFLKAIHRKKTPDWLVAYVPSNSTSNIYIFNNEDKLTAKKAISQLLMHEITHLYTNILNPNLPDWLKEGISVYVSSQIFKSSISTTDWKKIAPKEVPFKGVSWKFAAEHNGYNIAGMLVMFFVRRYGWKKFIIAINFRRSAHFSIKNIPSYFNDEFDEFMRDFKKQFVK